MRGMKYIQFQVGPKASLVWKSENPIISTHFVGNFLSTELNSCAHIIENGRPPLHGDALEDSENGKQDVVELRDAIIGTDPGVVAFIALWTLPHSAGKRQLWRVNSLVVYKNQTIE